MNSPYEHPDVATSHQPARLAPPYPSLANEIATCFATHRLGYRGVMASGQIERIDSPALTNAVIGPALFAVSRPAWDKVDQEYREALVHLRRLEIDEALMDAQNALESALRAIGCKGPTLKHMLNAYRVLPAIKPYAAGVANHVATLIDDIQMWRGEAGHGKDSGHPEPPLELAASRSTGRAR